MKRPKRRRWFRKRWAAAVVAVPLVIAALALLLALLGVFDEPLRLRLEAALTRAVGAPARVEQLDIGWFPLSARIGGLSFEIPAEAGGRLRVEVPAASASLSWGAWFSAPAGRLRFGHVHLERPQLLLVEPFAVPRGENDPAPTRIDLRIGRLVIEDGSLRLDDRITPMAFTVDQLQLEGEWGAFRRAMLGRVRWESTFQQDPIAQPLPFVVEAGFRWRGNRIDLSRGRVTAPGIEATLDARADWVEGFRFSGDAVVEGDVDRLRPFLSDDFPRCGGLVRGSLFFEQANGPLMLQADVEAGPIRFERFAAAAATTQLTYRPGALELKDLDARGYGGRIRGSVLVDLGRGDRLTLELTGEGVDLPELLEVLDRPLPLGGETEFRLLLNGQADSPESWSAEGSFVVRASDNERFPTSGTGRVAIGGGRLQVAARDVATAEALLDLDLALPLAAGSGLVTISGSTADALRTQQGTLAVLGALGVEPPEILLRPLRGHGDVATRLRLDEGNDRLRVELDLADGSWLGYEFEVAGLVVESDRDGVRIDPLSVQGGGRSIEGRLALTPAGSLDGLDLSAEGLTLPWLLAAGGVDVPTLDGVAAGRLSLERRADGLHGEGHVAVQGLEYYGEQWGKLESPLSVAGDRMRLTDVLVSGPAATLTGGVAVDLAGGGGSVDVERATLELDGLGATSEMLGGVATVTGGLAFDSDGLIDGSLQVRVERLEVASYGAGDAEGRLNVQGERLTLELDERPDEKWRLRSLLTLGEEPRVAGTLGFDRARVALLDPADGDALLEASGTLEFAGDPTNDASWTLAGSLEQARLELGVRTLTASEPVGVEFANGALDVSPIRLQTLHGTVEGYVRRDPEGVVDAHFGGGLDLGVLTTLSPALRASGPLRLDLTVRNDAGGLQLSGSAEASAGRLRLLGFPHTLEQVEAQVRFDRERILLSGLNGVLGGGEVTASGEATVAGDGLRFSAHAEGRGVRVLYPENFRAAYDASLDLVGGPDGTTLSGRLDMLRGLYDRPFTWTEWLGLGAREYTTEEIADQPEVRLDLQVRAEDGVWVRNDLMKIESSFDLRVGGELTRPEVSGRMQLFEDGTIRFREVEYRIVRGTVDFLELDRINPYLDLRAETQVASYDVQLHVEGTAERFSYELSSNPVLSQQDIIALLATGKTLEELAAEGRDAGAVFTGDLAANYFAGALTGRFERQLKDLLGLERVRIDPRLVSQDADPTARITLGKEVSDDLVLIYSTDVDSTESQIYQVEWRASRKLRFRGGRETTGGLGGDFQYSDRFWLGRGPRVSAAGVRAGGAPESEPEPQVKRIVRSVALIGLDEERRRELERRLPLSAGDPFERREMLEGAEIVRRDFVRRGRIDVTVRSEMLAVTGDPDRVDVIYRVTAGPPVQLRIDGVSKKEAKRLRKLLEQRWVDAIIGEDLIEDSAAEIRKYFQSRGYYAVDVLAYMDEDESLLRVEVDRGSVVSVELLTIEGAAGVDEARIRRQIQSKRGSLFARPTLIPEVLREDLAAVRNLYRDEGFLRAEIEPPQIGLSTDGERAQIVIRIHEGPRFEVGEVVFPGELPFEDEKLREWSGLAVGSVFAPSRLLEAESGLRARIDAAGYPDARVRGRYNVGEGIGIVDVEFTIVAGEAKRIAAIELAGNRLTRASVIRRELRLEAGDPLSREGLLRMQHRLYRLGVFRNVRIEQLPDTAGRPGWYRLRLQLEEAKPLALTFGAGADTEGGARGLFSIAHQNVLGRDQTVALQAKLSGIEERAQITYEFPTLGGVRLPGLVALGYQRREETDFTVERRSSALRLETKLSPKLTAFTRLNLQRVDLTDIADPTAPLDDKLENVQLGDLSYTLAYDSRDDPFLTRSGTYLALETQLFTEALASDANFAKWFLSGTRTRSFANRQTLAAALRVGLARPYGGTSVVPLSERFFAGGDSTLRGFPRDGVGPIGAGGFRLGGEALLLLNTEWRFPIWGALRGVFFYDAGNVYLEVGDLDPTDLRHVLGAGLRFETPIGPLRLEYGHKLDRLAGESDGELFIAIGSAF